jgi:hypothetical protein
MAILLKNENITKPVMDFIYDKQAEFKKEAGQHISLEKTIARLIKEAYLSKPQAKK